MNDLLAGVDLGILEDDIRFAIRWVPTAFLIDGSKIESRAIEIGFGIGRLVRGS